MNLRFVVMPMQEMNVGDILHSTTRPKQAPILLRRDGDQHDCGWIEGDAARHLQLRPFYPSFKVETVSPISGCATVKVLPDWVTCYGGPSDGETILVDIQPGMRFVAIPRPHVAMTFADQSASIPARSFRIARYEVQLSRHGYRLHFVGME